MKKVAIQGIRGSFHEEAATYYFKEDFIAVECMDFRSLANQVASGDSHWGVMAVENSLAGAILPNFSLIRNSGLQIIGEVYLRITQNLMALPGETISSLTEVRSHPMALLQAEDFFLQHPAIRLVESYDTALSAKEIADQSLKGIGGVGSHRAAEIFGLSILAPSIETNKKNFTRFLVVGRQQANLPDQGQLKASIAFISPHSPGSLAGILKPLADWDVNLSLIQSLPLIGKTWEYIFHADMVFKNQEHAVTSLQKLDEMIEDFWVLGIYPQGEKFGINGNGH
jgi:prephenate dehydratase